MGASTTSQSTSIIDIQFGFSNSNSADSTTYYFTGLANSIGPATTQAQREIDAPYSMLLIGAAIEILCSGPGSGESVQLYLRVNNTTDTGIKTDMQFNAVHTRYNVTGLSAIVNANNRFQCKMITPAFATNPTGVYLNVILYFERT